MGHAIFILQWHAAGHHYLGRGGVQSTARRVNAILTRVCTLLRYLTSDFAAEMLDLRALRYDYKHFQR